MDLLRTIRGHHYALVALCLSALVTAFVPLSTMHYRLAYDEIELLELANELHVSSYVSKHLELTLSAALDTDVQVHVYVEPDRSEEDPGKLFLDLHRSPETITRLLRATYANEDITYQNATFSQIRKAFGLNLFVPILDLPKSIEEFGEEHSGAEQALQWKLLNDCLEEGKSQRVIVKVQYDWYRGDLAIPGEVDSGPTSASVRISGKDCTEVAFSYIEFRELFSDLFGEPETSEGILVALMNEFHRPEPTKSLLGMSELPVWRVVENMTVAQAKRELGSKLEATGHRPMILGVSLYHALATVVIPISILLAQILLAVHANHARGRVASEDLQTSAWIGVYQDWTAQLIAIVSYSILPAASVYYLTMSAGQPNWGRWLAGACFLMGLVILIAVWLLRHIPQVVTSSSPIERRFRRSR